MLVMTDKKEGDYNPKSSKCQTTVELSECLKISLKNILSLVTDDKFVSIYKSCYKEFEKKDEVGRPSLSGSSIEGKKYLSQFNDIIIKSLLRTIEETVFNMDSKLTELEELKAMHLENNVLWRPPGNVSQHMVPFEFISEMRKKKELEGKIEKEQEELRLLKARLTQKRNKAQELNKILLLLIDDIKNIVTSKVND